MTYKGDPIAEKLDKLAEATGIPRLQRKYRYSNPVRFRMLPIALLTMAFGVTVLGSLAFGLGKIGAMIGLWDIWAPRSGLDWMAVTFFLLNLEANIAVLAASAATPEPLEEEEE